MLTHLLLGLALVTGSPAPQPPPEETAGPITYRTTGSRIAVAQDVDVAADEEIQDAVVAVAGSLRVAGRIRHGAIVVGGNVHLLPTADVQGDLVLVGGTLIRDQGARVAGSVSYVSLGDWTRSVGLFDWRPRLQFGSASRWVSLAATILRISILAALMVFVLLIARAPVARVGRAAAAAPFRAAVVGLAAEVLFLPVLLVASLGLGITIIGLPLVFLVIPFAFVIAFVALLLGYTALACRLGEWIEDRLGWRLHSAYLATAMGLFLIVLPTLMARVLGIAPEPLRMAAFAVLVAGVTAEFLVWTIGLGAALMTGFGRWNTIEA